MCRSEALSLQILIAVDIQLRYAFALLIAVEIQLRQICVVLLIAVDTALVDMSVSSRSAFAFDLDAVVCSYTALVT